MTEIRRCVPRGDGNVSRDCATGKESVVNNVVQRGTFLRVGCEYLLHELTRIERDLPVGRKLVLIIADAPANGDLRLQVLVSLPENSLIHFFNVLGLEGWSADHKRV